ncbi:cytochrome P450 709B2-like [Nymphaea colorata]|nr:cytochrome P450 709B2-like [Nymphaea colorata]
MALPFELRLTLLVLSSIFIPIACKLFIVLIWKPLAIQSCFKKQGIGGPQRHLLHGSMQEMMSLEQEAINKPIEGFSHDIASRVLPAYHKWSKRYGELFLYWVGTEPRFCVTDADMIREMLKTKFGLFTKDDPIPALKALLGKGLVLATDEKWVEHRRVINPAFHVDRLKGMTKAMASCTISMLSTWTDEEKELEVHEQLKQLTADIIAQTAFGSSYREGKEVFTAQEELILMAIASFGDISVPGLQYLPTKRNRQLWKLEKRARDNLKFIINSRIRSAVKAGGFGDDLLGMMMESSRGEDGRMSMSLNEIMDECMTFFFAGHETTANLLTWAMFLLSIYPDWQTKLRQEVMDLCGRGTPDADMLGKLKLTNMFLMETLRLYPPVLLMLRKTAKELKLGNVLIPKDVTITLPILMVHRKPEYWGEDADEFNPLRFSQGLSRAGKHPNAMMPFSFGPRVCVGQSFAMMEGKLVLAMILQRYSFSLSPGYKHAPFRLLTLRPQFGLPILLQPVHV